MAKLQWDVDGGRLYETGVSNAVLFIKKATRLDSDISAYETGIAWSGITQIDEKPAGADANKLYADNLVYLNIRGTETFSATVQAYMYPDEWMECDGSKNVGGAVFGQQARKAFGIAFRTRLGNDTEFDEYSEKLHLIYNATASVSERSYQTVNESPEAITFSWDMETTSVKFQSEAAIAAGLRPVSCITIEKKNAGSNWDTLINMIEGTDSTAPYLPDPDKVYELFSATLGALTVTSIAGGSTGNTKVSATGAASGESLVYKLGTSAQTVAYNDNVSSWTNLTNVDIPATSGQIVTVVAAVDGKAKKVGTATVVAKA